MPTTAKEYDITVYTSDGGSTYYFHNLHLVGGTQDIFRPYRFYDGISKATILINNGTIKVVNATINDIDFLTNAVLIVQYR